MHELRQQGSIESETINSTIGNDSLLVAGILRKDRKATAEFVARFADPIHRYIRSRLAPRYDQIEDLVQETFLSAWEHLSSYTGSGPLQGWLIGIARHKVEDYYRARLRAPEPIEDVDASGDLLASDPKIHQFAEQAQQKKKAHQVLISLPESYRLALIWRYWDKASAREMALKTGKTEKAIERLLARARAEFRERWSSGKSA